MRSTQQLNLCSYNQIQTGLCSNTVQLLLKMFNINGTCLYLGRYLIGMREGKVSNWPDNIRIRDPDSGTDLLKFVISFCLIYLLSSTVFYQEVRTQFPIFEVFAFVWFWYRCDILKLAIAVDMDRNRYHNKLVL